MQMCPACSKDNQDSASFCAYCGELLIHFLGCNTLLENRYLILEVLGHGAMGVVYLAEDNRITGRLVAIKVNLSTDPDAQAQFQSEVNLMVGLKHPGLPTISDQFADPFGRQYLVMDYVAGETLEDIVIRRGSLPEDEVKRWALSLLVVLDYLHSRTPQSIIHRDIKPANIKITPEGELVLVDFGIAKAHATGRLTQHWARGFGTPGFASIEQYHGGTDARSDLYSVGAVMYFMLTGTIPPDAPAIASGTSITPPRDLGLAVSMRMQDVVLRAMTQDPIVRFQTANEMQRALVTGVVSGSTQPIMRSGSSAWIWLAVSGIFMALVIGFLIFNKMTGGGGASTPTSVAVSATLGFTGPVPSATPTPTSSGTDTVVPTRRPPTNTPTSTITPTSQPPTTTSTFSPPTKTPTPRPPTRTPTPRPPTDTPIPTPYAVVVNNELNVRAGPSTDYKIVIKVRKGDQMVLLGRNELCTWFQVRVPGGVGGWVTTQYVDASVEACIPPLSTAEPLPPTATPRPRALASNTRDFTGDQGANNWWYQVENGRNSGKYSNFSTFSVYQPPDGSKPRHCWQTPQEGHVRICENGEVHPGATGRIAYRWRTDRARNVKIYVHAHKIDTKCGNNDGVWIGVYRVPQNQPPQTMERDFIIRGANAYDRPQNTYQWDISLNADDSIMVMVDISRTSACDMTRLYIDIY